MSFVLSPLGVGRSFPETISSPNRFGALEGRTLGLLDNAKPKADLLEARIEELFRERSSGQATPDGGSTRSVTKEILG